jgi:hypothetical protein
LARRANQRKLSSSRIKNISLYQNSDLRHKSRRPAPNSRDVSRSSRYVGCGMRWTLQRQVMSSPDENVCSGRRSRVVLAPRPWRQTGGRYPAGDGGKKRRSPGRARISRNTIARGKPGCPGCTCSSTRVLSCATLRTRDCGRSRRPAFPAPSSRKRDNETHNPGENQPRECTHTRPHAP